MVPFKHKQSLFINGQFRASSSEESSEIVNPATGDVITEVAEASVEDVDQAVQGAVKAYNDVWQPMAPKERRRCLWKFAQKIRENVLDLASLESKNVGKPIRESIQEVNYAAECFEFYSSCESFTVGETQAIRSDALYFTLRQPYGVCGLILPWNYPLLIAAWKIAPALAAGNTVVVKPASMTPLSILYLAKLAVDAGIPPGVLNVVTGSGKIVGDALVRHPLVPKISFSGTTEVGKEVIRVGTDKLTRVTANLGGKSASIIFSDVNLDDVASSVVANITSNSGQNCYARSRLLIEKTIYNRLVEKIKELLEGVKIGDPLNEATEMGPLISNFHRERVLKYIELGKSEGANLVTGGVIPEPFAHSRGAYLTPALFSDVTSKMYIFKEEILGAVLCAMPFTSEDEALQLANASIYGLNVSIWTSNGSRALRMAKALATGMVSINSDHDWVLELPVGGMKESGVGRELGVKALEEFTELKSISFPIK
ncbi:MAG: aldehyde dehydrogenase [Calditrichaeota bacterium]|nr:MAG: aldehyde dehydrogenase [Calditrichota bacterium]